MSKTHEEAITFAVRQILMAADEGINRAGKFTLALSGGSTPKVIYQKLAKDHKMSVDWTKAYIFFSDERCVPPTSDESNYKMAMENGIKELDIPESQIFRMKGELDPALAAEEYAALIKTHVPDEKFDLIMLGMGNDGHTASLFPDSAGLAESSKMVIANFIPKLNTWRLTFTFPLINKAHHINVYILGDSKAPMVKEIFSTKRKYPIQRLDFKKTVFVLDEGACCMLK